MHAYQLRNRSRNRTISIELDTTIEYAKYVNTGFLPAVDPLVIDRAEGATYYGKDGSSFIDCFAGISVVNSGHANKQVIGAAREQVGVRAAEIRYPVTPSKGTLTSLPRDQRMGILTHPGWLVSHSDAMDNHAIHRGKWIRERLLGGGRDIGALAAHVDVMPTLTELCGLKSVPAVQGDGASFAGALRGTEPAPMYGRTLFVHSQRVEHPRKWRKSAVMTQRWRLVNGKQLFDMRLDPGQRDDVAAANEEVVARLREAYEGWWRTLEPTFDQYVRIDLGGAQNPTHMMSHDWHTEDKGTPWHQNHVRNGYVSNGPWAVDVAAAGRYRVTLRRWPAIEARAMDCVEASIEIGNVRAKQEVVPGDESASFEVTLPAGPAMLLTTLRRADGKEHGAYFAEVERLD